uniref:Reverse transcriptase domain-containing protein n=1 Tax=Salvator merianae TaxID=96440 RepID=A0A8D0KLK4_SALMN
MKDNIRSIIDVIEYLESHNEVQAALIFLDAEKAFDNLNWNFMFNLLDTMNFGENFTKWIRAIYTTQSAQLTINGEVTQKFSIQKGTGQGCPLSPLLFILVLEVMNRAIRQETNIEGLKIKKEEYRLRAFADDIVIILKDPMESIEKVKLVIETFGRVAGLKINEKKTKILVKNMRKKEQEDLGRKAGFDIEKKVKYLGVWLTKQNLALYQNNYVKLWSQVKQDLEIWSKLKLSLLGRISVLKMNVLPRVMFLFQSIPIIIKDEVFKKWQKDLTSFIWQGKKPRIRFKLMQDAKERGGLGLPNLKLYFAACCLSWIVKWFWLRDKRLLQLEGFDLRYGLHGCLWYDKVKVNAAFKNHYVRHALWITWSKYKSKLYPRIPMWVSPHEALFKEFGRRERWIKYEEVLSKNNETDEFSLKTREQLNQEGLEVQWLMYTQLMDVFKEDKRRMNFELERQKWEEKLEKEERGIVGVLYDFLLKIELEQEQVKDCMIKWAQNFGYNISMDQWEKLWTKDMKSTVCNMLKENIHKMMYRWYLTPFRISKMYQGMSSKCWKCKKHEGTFYHMWWTCVKTKKFWVQIHIAMQKILKTNIPFRLELFLLGIVENNVEGVNVLLQNMITAARIVYAQKWKGEILPTVDDWLVKMMELAKMDKLTNLLRIKTVDRFYRNWKPFIDFLQEMDNGLAIAGFEE